MQPFKTIKHKLLAFLVIGFISFNQPIVFAEESTTAADAHQGHSETLDWPGLYHAILPCEDCKGIKSTLALNKNGSYVLTSEYLAKSSREYVEKGKFKWSDKPNVILLTPKKGSTTPQQFLVSQDMLTKLDQDGELHTGELANRYIFRRHDVTKPPSEHSGH